MTLFSANLGFLWSGLALPEAIRAAARAGFDAVECHWPYGEDRAAVKTALEETGLPMLSVNTSRGDAGAGELGLAALPGDGARARAAMDEALGFARAVEAQAVHVLAGRARGAAARAAFLDTLGYACAAAGDLGVLIEPLNRHDAPGYFLETCGEAAEIIEAVGAPNLRLMFDCYHVARTEGDVAERLEEFLPLIGHIQFAGVPERGRPDEGRLDYGPLFARIAALGWVRPLGAEYRPEGPTEASLGWMAGLRGIST